MTSIRRRGLAALVLWGGIACSLVLAGPTGATADESPRWRFKAGEDLVWRVEQNFDINMTLGENGANVPTGGEILLDMKLHIDEVDDQGKARATFSIGRVRMSVDAGVMKFNYDSAKKEQDDDGNPAAAMMAKAFDAMMKLTYKVSISPLGEFSDIVVPDNAVAALQGLPGMDQLGGLMDKETFKNSFSQLSGQGWLVFPDRELKQGDSWKQELEMKNPALGTQKMLVEYVYDGQVEQGGRKLDAFKVTVDINFEVGDDAKIPAKITVEEQKQEGMIYFDRAAGRIDHSDIKMHLKMDIEAMRQQITQTIDGTNKARFLTAEEAAASSDNPAEESPQKD